MEPFYLCNSELFGLSMEQSRNADSLSEVDVHAENTGTELGRVPAEQQARIDFPHVTYDTLPRVSRDTPRTKSRMKATVNFRDLRPFSKLTKWYNKARRKLAGWMISPAKLE